MKTRLLVTFFILTALALHSPLRAAGDAKSELNALVAKISAKLRTGVHTEPELAVDLAEFDTLLAAHRGDTSDDVAQILVIKAMIYVQIIGETDKGIAMLQKLKADFPSSKQASQVDAVLAAIEAQREFDVGKVFPDFDEKDLDGKPLSVAGHRGKVVLIDFWATWCGPCVAELPNVVAAYKKYHARGFDIIGISLDRANDRQKLVDFMAKHEMPWPQFYDGKYWDNKLSKRYGISSIPATFLLDGDGKIIARDLRGPALDEELAKRLGAK